MAVVGVYNHVYCRRMCVPRWSGKRALCSWPPPLSAASERPGSTAPASETGTLQYFDQLFVDHLALTTEMHMQEAKSERFLNHSQISHFLDPEEPVVINTFERPALLEQAVRHWAACPRVHAIRVVHSSLDKTARVADRPPTPSRTSLHTPGCNCMPPAPRLPLAVGRAAVHLEHLVHEGRRGQLDLETDRRAGRVQRGRHLRQSTA